MESKQSEEKKRAAGFIPAGIHYRGDKPRGSREERYFAFFSLNSTIKSRSFSTPATGIAL